MNLTNKKSTPEGAPLTQDNGTTFRSRTQWLAEILFEMIGKYNKPIKRPRDPSVDIAFRELIAAANKNGDCIINDGAGYYRPRRGNDIDEHCYEQYKAKELARAKDIIDKIKAMDEAFYGGTHELI